MLARRGVVFGIATVTTLSTAVVPTPAKDRIIFTRNGPSAAELYIAKGDGTGEQKLLSTSEMDGPPDGQLIAFSSDRNTLSRRRSVIDFEQVQRRAST